MGLQPIAATGIISIKTKAIFILLVGLLVFGGTNPPFA